MGCTNEHGTHRYSTSAGYLAHHVTHTHAGMMCDHHHHHNNNNNNDNNNNPAIATMRVNPPIWPTPTDQ